MKKFNMYPLMRHFTLKALIAFSITGLILTTITNNHIRTEILSSMEQLVHFTLHYVVEPYINTDKIHSSLPENEIEILNEKFQGIINNGTMILVNVWNKNNEIVYSTNNNFIGKINTENENLNQIFLSTKVQNNFEENTTILVKDNYKGSKILKIYIPIIKDNKITGVYEVFESYSQISHHEKKMTFLISLTIFVGLLALYLLLIKVIYNTSKTLVNQNNQLKEKNIEVQEAYEKLNDSYKNTIIALSSSIDARDSYTAGHSERVATLSVEIGKSLNLSPDELETLELAARFHDIGKLGIPDKILNKVSKLTEDEFNMIKEHPSIGVNILKEIDLFKEILPIILYHHEKYAGGGYPLSIKGDEIPLASRIIAVADTYDAMTSDRPYRKSLSHIEALSELDRFKDIQFDGKVVSAFINLHIDVFSKCS